MLGTGVLASALSSCRVPAPRTESGDPLADPVYLSSTRAIATAIGRREISSEEIVRACLERIQAVNTDLNAVVQITAERAIARAREADAAMAVGTVWGPLHGVPMTIKDSFDTAGVITTGGTAGRRSFVPDRDATVVQRLKDAGAILLGKTNTPELTLSFETDNLVYGPTSNPYDLTRTPGGSSGGAAAIVAAGGVPFDIGSDFGGSIRLPAHYCGIAGIKPTTGRVPRTGHIYPFGGVQDSFQQVGPLARWVDDLSFILPLIAGPDWIDPGVTPLPWYDPREVDLQSLRVSFHTDNGIAMPDLATRNTVTRVAGELRSAVASVEEARPAGIEASLILTLRLVIWDGGAAVRRMLDEAGTEEHTLLSFEVAQPISAEEMDRLLVEWYGFRSRMESFMGDYDAIVCPVNSAPALLHGGTATGSLQTAASFSYTQTYNLTGWPAVVVRAGTSPEGLPIGVQIVARPGREDVALALARFVELELGGYQAPMIFE